MDSDALIQEQIAFHRQFARDYNGQVYDREHWENLADTALKGCPHVGKCLELASRHRAMDRAVIGVRRLHHGCGRFTGDACPERR
jgi:hypothetical protein